MSLSTWSWPAIVALVMGASACQNNEPGATAAPPPSSAATKPTGPESTPAPAGCPANDELAALDHRTPLPLQPMMAWHQKQNMMEHLVAIQRIADGLARDDWEAVANASALIESSPQMQQMCEHMGAGAPGFTDLALEFHRRADAIGDAARKRDRTAALRATATTLQACTDCHAAYRQEVVTATDWQQRTGSAHAPAGMHGGH